MNEEHRTALTQSIDDISQNLDFAAMLPYLRAKGILSQGQVEDLQSPSRQSTRNMQLVDCIIQAGPTGFTEFINALNKNGKTYLAEMILRRVPSATGQQNVARQVHVGSGRKLSAKALTKNVSQFYAKMAPTEVTGHLQSAEIITGHEAQQIFVERVSFQQNILLVGMVQQRGPKALEVFAKALEETLQGHLADLLYEE
uniref:CARD domain-containing protein n=1 Tax=Plectus sambesii TaxID=2011161 RepID=A0A914UTE4_9BILA